MSKRDFTESFGEIKAMTKKIRQLNESISFADDDENPDAMGMEDEPQQPQPQDGEMKKQDPIESEVGEGNQEINAVRKICLKGMSRLADTPENPEYQALKKVFTMIDRAVDKKEEGENQ